MKAILLICTYAIIKAINPEFVVEYENFFNNMLIIVIIFDLIKYVIDKISDKK